MNISSEDDSTGFIKTQQEDFSEDQWMGKNRYFTDLTDAYPSNIISNLNDKPESQILTSTPMLRCPIGDFPTISPVVGSEMLFETSFKRDINNHDTSNTSESRKHGNLPRILILGKQICLLLV